MSTERVQREKKQSLAEALAAEHGENDGESPAAFWNRNNQSREEAAKNTTANEGRADPLPRKEKKTVATQILLTKTQARKLQLIKEVTGLSKNAIIGYLIDSYEIEEEE